MDLQKIIAIQIHDIQNDYYISMHFNDDMCIFHMTYMTFRKNITLNFNIHQHSYGNLQVIKLSQLIHENHI